MSDEPDILMDLDEQDGIQDNIEIKSPKLYKKVKINQDNNKNLLHVDNLIQPLFKQISQASSNNIKNQKYINFEDPFILKLLQQKNMDFIKVMAQEKQIQFRIRSEQVPAFIEIIPSIELNKDEDLQEFEELILQIKTNLKNEIKQLQYGCSFDEYQSIVKHVSNNQSLSQNLKLVFYDEEGNQNENEQNQNEQKQKSNLEILKDYVINGRNIIKLSKFKKIYKESFKQFDILFLNCDREGILTDSIGFDIKQAWPEIGQRLKEIRKNLQLENSKYLFDLDISYSQDRQQFLFLSVSEYKHNNLEIFCKMIQKQELKAKGFLSIALAVDLINCDYEEFFSKFISILQQGNEDSYLDYPTEFTFLFNEEQEKSVLNYFQSAKICCNLKPSKLKKPGYWSFSVKNQLQQQQQIQQQQRAILYQQQQQNIDDNDNQNEEFEDQDQLLLEKSYIQKHDRVLLLLNSKPLKDQQKLNKNQLKAIQQYPPLYGAYQGKKAYQQQLQQQNQNNKQEEYEELMEEIEIDLNNMQENLLTSNAQRPIIKQTENEVSTYYYIDQISQNFSEFEESLQQIISQMTKLGVITYKYQRNMLDYSILSVCCQVDLLSMSMQIKTQQELLQQKQLQENAVLQQQNYLNPLQIAPIGFGFGGPHLQNYNSYSVLRIESSEKGVVMQEQIVENKANYVQIEEKDLQSNNNIYNEKNDQKEKENSQLLSNKSQIFITALKEDLELFQQQIYEPKIKKKYITHTIPKTKKNVNLDYAVSISKHKNIKLSEDNEKICIMGYRKNIERNFNLIMQSVNVEVNDQFPHNWQKQNENCELFKLQKKDSEYQDAKKLVLKTSPHAKIRKIQRIQNLQLWKNYQFEKTKLQQKGSNPNEMLLFHGTRANDPQLIYKGEEGFDFRLSHGGMWGRGIYFAQDSSYSLGYVFADPKGPVFILAKVLVGNNYTTAPGNFSCPPFQPGSKSLRYDSVSNKIPVGAQNGGIYIIYNNSRAYPQYLIQFKQNMQRNQFAFHALPHNMKIKQNIQGDDSSSDSSESLPQIKKNQNKKDLQNQLQQQQNLQQQQQQIQLFQQNNNQYQSEDDSDGDEEEEEDENDNDEEDENDEGENDKSIPTSQLDLNEN